MLLKSFTISQILDCIADPSKIRVVASLSDHVDEVFPYLNAILDNVAYSPEARIITLKKGHRLITLYPHMVTIAKADDENDARETLSWLQRTINQTWERREGLTPSYERRMALRPLDVYSLLPKSNCKLCGEATCMAFAVSLLQGTKGIAQCPPLAQDQYARNRELLAGFLGAGDLLRA